MHLIVGTYFTTQTLAAEDPRKVPLLSLPDLCIQQGETGTNVWPASCDHLQHGDDTNEDCSLACPSLCPETFVLSTFTSRVPVHTTKEGPSNLFF